MTRACYSKALTPTSEGAPRAEQPIRSSIPNTSPYIRRGLEGGKSFLKEIQRASLGYRDHILGAFPAAPRRITIVETTPPC